MNIRITTLLILTLVAGCKTENKKTDVVTNSVTDSIQPPAMNIPMDTLATASPVPSAPNFNLLTGDWERTDGGYTISIRNITADGNFKAEYFNPKPIHVGKAKWELEDNSLYLQVELQDVNYPGSLYTLEYLPNADKLSGIYFQAVEGATYEVTFDRKR